MQRDTTIDGIKALLLLFVVYYHVMEISANWFHNDSPYFPMLHSGEWFVKTSWMQVFFIVTGYCSNFDKQRSVFYKSILNSIVLPSTLWIIFQCCILVIAFKNPIYLKEFIQPFNISLFWKFWFIPALFMGKIFFYEINKLFGKNILLPFILLACCCIGIFLYDLKIYNILYFEHGLVFAILFYIGTLLKKLSIKQIKFMGFSYIPIMIFSFFAYNVIPSCGFSIDIYYYDIPVYLLYSITGFCFWYLLVSLINNRMFVYLGKRTLELYILNFCFIQISLTRLYPYFSLATIHGTFLVVIITFLFTVVASSFLCCTFEKLKRIQLNCSCF